MKVIEAKANLPAVGPQESEISGTLPALVTDLEHI
jgi:hypothetical protein